MLKSRKVGLSKTTLARMYWPLMELESTRGDRCEVCGRAWPLNSHHIVRRGAGNLYADGKPLPKPTITLCGMGNVLRDADGRLYCHGAAHSGMLHFRNNHGQREYLFTDPMPYFEALQVEEGWKGC